MDSLHQDRRNGSLGGSEILPARNRTDSPNQKGILASRSLPDRDFDQLWDGVILPPGVKDQLLAQAVLNFTARDQLRRAGLPLHGIIVLVGPPGTGKTSIARGLASRTAASLKGVGGFTYLEIEPHALASAALGKSQQAVRHLLGTVIAEHADAGPCVVLLDEVETLAASRNRMSLEANPVDVHRATDAVLAQLDQLALTHPQILFIATSNFSKAIDEAFLSRADLVLTIGLPDLQACAAILLDTITRVAGVFPRLKVTDDPLLKSIANRCVGLDGRRIRKAVLAALATNKETALDPARVTASDILVAIERAQTERATTEGLQ